MALLVDASESELHRIYDLEADFVYRSLARLGVRESDRADLLQDAFLVVYRRLPEFDASRPIRPWLFGICLNLVRNHRRRAAREPVLSLPAEDSVDHATPEAELEGAERRRLGQRALDALTPDKRSVFVMFELEGMGAKAIAALLDVPLGTVHSRIHSARATLLAALTPGEPDDSRNWLFRKICG